MGAQANAHAPSTRFWPKQVTLTDYPDRRFPTGQDRCLGSVLRKLSEQFTNSSERRQRLVDFMPLMCQKKAKMSGLVRFGNVGKRFLPVEDWRVSCVFGIICVCLGPDHWTKIQSFVLFAKDNVHMHNTD